MVFARRIVDLMLMRSGPQDMPGDQTSLVGSALAYCILLFIQVGMIAPVSAALLQAVLATLLLGIYIGALLRLRKAPNRFNQTATSMYAVGATLTLIMLAPTHAMAPYLDAIGQSSNPRSVPMPSGFVALAYVVVGFWGLAIYSHIYRHALDCRMALGVAAAIGFELFLMLVVWLIG